MPAGMATERGRKTHNVINLSEAYYYVYNK